MAELTDDKLLELTDETLVWGHEVAEMWAGTPYQYMIEKQIDSVEKTLEHSDLKKVRALVYDLAQFLDNAEKEYNEGE